MSLLGLVYLVATALLAVYGLNSLVLTWLYLCHRREDAPCPPLAETPAVTVQLPIYNELYVVERLIDAVPFFLLNVSGFGYVAFCSLWHSLLDREFSLAVMKRERVRGMGSRSLTRGGECGPESRKPLLERA